MDEEEFGGDDFYGGETFFAGEDFDISLVVFFANEIGACYWGVLEDGASGSDDFLTTVWPVFKIFWVSIVPRLEISKYKIVMVGAEGFKYEFVGVADGFLAAVDFDGRFNFGAAVKGLEFREVLLEFFLLVLE